MCRYIKPSYINTEEPFWGSEFKQSELEDIACCIVIFCQKNGDVWIDFTINELWPKASIDNYYFRNYLVPDGYLTVKDNVYKITDKFINVVSKFLNEEKENV